MKDESREKFPGFYSFSFCLATAASRLTSKESNRGNFDSLFLYKGEIMRAKFTAVILLFVFGFVVSLQAKTKNQIDVKINQQQTLPKTKLTIKFASLIEDSRCPTDAQCIQAGEAKIQIAVRNGKGAWKTFEISTKASKQSVAFAGYTICLLDLNPHPATNIRIDRNGYTATFSVTAKK